MKEGGKVEVRQVRSARGRNQRTIGTLKSLGLGRLGDCAEHKISRSILGAISRIKHLVVVREI